MKAWMIGVFFALVFSMSLIVGNKFDIEILTDIGVSMAWVSIIFYYIISASISLALFCFSFGDAKQKGICREFILIFNETNSKPRALFYLINSVFAIMFLFLSGFIITGVSLAVMGVASRYLTKVAARKILCSMATI